MSTNFLNLKWAAFFLSFAGLTFVASELSAPAFAADLTDKEVVKTQPNRLDLALTSASALMAEPTVAQTPNATSENEAFVVAQTDGTVVPGDTTPGTTPTTPGTSGIAPGRVTRGGSSYVGVGGNIGLSGGETALGIGNFTVISKIGLANAVSLRPGVVIGDDTTFLIPITYDFTLRQRDVVTRTVTAAPYVGGGLAVATGNNSDVGPLLTAGVDVPINSQFTATGGVNVGFFDDASVGLLVGVGYNF